MNTVHPTELIGEQEIPRLCQSEFLSDRTLLMLHDRVYRGLPIHCVRENTPVWCVESLLSLYKREDLRQRQLAENVIGQVVRVIGKCEWDSRLVQSAHEYLVHAECTTSAFAKALSACKVHQPHKMINSKSNRTFALAFCAAQKAAARSDDFAEQTAWLSFTECALEKYDVLRDFADRASKAKCVQMKLNAALFCLRKLETLESNILCEKVVRLCCEWFPGRNDLRKYIKPPGFEHFMRRPYIRQTQVLEKISRESCDEFKKFMKLT